MGPSFNPFVICLLYHLPMKTAFLVGIMSAQRVEEMQARMLSPPYTMFCKDRIALRPHPKFLPKSVSI